MENSLKDKVVIITGGTRGIGRAIVLSSIKNGAKVVFTYQKSDDAANAIVDDVRTMGGDCLAVKADAKSYAEARSVVDAAIEKFGKLDALVNNAGITKDKALMMMDPTEWQEVIDVNLTGYFNMSKACIVTMLKQKSGNIVNISSVAGIVGLPRQVNYSAAKAGIIGLTKSLAKEVAPYGIRVNAIAPGYIDTDMTKNLKQREQFEKMVPSGRFGRPEEVAEAVIFIMSDLSKYITGQVVKVDGGLAM